MLQTKEKEGEAHFANTSRYWHKTRNFVMHITFRRIYTYLFCVLSRDTCFYSWQKRGNVKVYLRHRVHDNESFRRHVGVSHRELWFRVAVTLWKRHKRKEWLIPVYVVFLNRAGNIHAKMFKRRFIATACIFIRLLFLFFFFTEVRFVVKYPLNFRTVFAKTKNNLRAYRLFELICSTLGLVQVFYSSERNTTFRSFVIIKIARKRLMSKIKVCVISRVRICTHYVITSVYSFILRIKKPM